MSEIRNCANCGEPRYRHGEGSHVATFTMACDNGFPNEAHAAAVRRHTSQAAIKLTVIADEADRLKKKLDNGHRLDASDVQALSSAVSTVIERLAILDTLRDVREWDASYARMGKDES